MMMTRTVCGPAAASQKGPGRRRSPHWEAYGDQLNRNSEESENSVRSDGGSNCRRDHGTLTRVINGGISVEQNPIRVVTIRDREELRNLNAFGHRDCRLSPGPVAAINCDLKGSFAARRHHRPSLALRLYLRPGQVPISN
eukprot:750228-Hanusia_phi.AAC.2